MPQRRGFSGGDTAGGTLGGHRGGDTAEDLRRGLLQRRGLSEQGECHRGRALRAEGDTTEGEPL